MGIIQVKVIVDHSWKGLRPHLWGLASKASRKYTFRCNHRSTEFQVKFADLHRSNIHPHVRWQGRTAALQFQMTRREEMQGERLLTPGREVQHLHKNADLLKSKRASCREGPSGSYLIVD